MLIDVDQQNVVVVEKIADSLVVSSASAVASENFDERYRRYNNFDDAPLRGIEHGSAHRAAIFYNRFPVWAENSLALNMSYPRA
jgi:hypothetical protein